MWITIPLTINISGLMLDCVYLNLDLGKESRYTYCRPVSFQNVGRPIPNLHWMHRMTRSRSVKHMIQFDLYGDVENYRELGCDSGGFSHQKFYDFWQDYVFAHYTHHPYFLVSQTDEPFSDWQQVRNTIKSCRSMSDALTIFRFALPYIESDPEHVLDVYDGLYCSIKKYFGYNRNPEYFRNVNIKI